MSDICSKDDLISRQAAIDALEEVDWYHQNKDKDMVLGANPSEHQAWYKEDDIFKTLEALPSAQPTLYGYNIEHLELIARVLQKEDLPPERIVEALTDIGRIVAIVKDEFEETLRKAVEQCMT